MNFIILKESIFDQPEIDLAIVLLSGFLPFEGKIDFKIFLNSLCLFSFNSGKTDSNNSYIKIDRNRIRFDNPQFSAKFLSLFFTTALRILIIH